MTPGLRRVRDSARRTATQYAEQAEDERPLRGYLVAMGVFTALNAAAAAVRDRRGATQVTARDVVLLGVATHKIARVLSKAAVTSPLRAPFTRYAGPGGPGEVREEVRGEGARHAAGELLTCPFCLSPWVATGLLTGLSVAPRPTRQVTAAFSAVAVADLLQLVYAAAQRHSES